MKYDDNLHRKTELVLHRYGLLRRTNSLLNKHFVLRDSISKSKTLRQHSEKCSLYQL